MESKTEDHVQLPENLNTAEIRIKREALQVVQEHRLTPLGFSAALAPITTYPKYNLPLLFWSAPKKFIQQVEKLQRWLVKTEAFDPRNPGDVILNLSTGEIIPVKSRRETLLTSQISGNKLILVRDGHNPTPVLWHLEGRVEKRLSPSPGRVDHLDTSDFFLNGDTITRAIQKPGWSPNIVVKDGTKWTTYHTAKGDLAENLPRQALVALLTSDGQPLLPRIFDFGELYVDNPHLLAEFIYKNHLYQRSEEAHKFSLHDISWLVVHATMGKIIGKYSYEGIMEDLDNGIPKKEVEDEIVVEAERALGTIGIKRENEITDISHLEEYFPGMYQNKDINFDTPQTAAEYIIPKLEPHGHHLLAEEIINLNPTLRSLRNVVLPPRFRFTGYDRIVSSAGWIAEDLQGAGRNVRREVLKRLYGEAEGRKRAVVKQLEDSLNEEFFREQVRKYIEICRPHIDIYWGQLHELMNKFSKEREAINTV